MCLHTHPKKVDVYPGMGHCQIRKKNPSGKLCRTEERKTGVEPNRLILEYLVQAPLAFFQ